VLIETDFIYFPKRVAAKGGIEVLRNQAIAAVGEPATSTAQTMLWDFPKLNRMVVAFDVNGKWSLHVYDRARRRAKPDYQDTTVAANENRIKVTVGAAVPVPQTANVGAGIPNQVAEAIQFKALMDNPGDQSTQDYAIVKQARAYQERQSFRCPSAMRSRVFEYLVGHIQRDHPDDYSTQLYILNRQVAAFEELRTMTTPEGMASSHFFELKRDARIRHPYDYSTQLYVLNEDIDKYLRYRLRNSNGDEILQHLLSD